MDAYIDLVMCMTILKLNGINDCWTGPPVLIKLCWETTRTML
jgi:hypothetical protein